MSLLKLILQVRAIRVTQVAFTDDHYNQNMNIDYFSKLYAIISDIIGNMEKSPEIASRFASQNSHGIS